MPPVHPMFYDVFDTISREYKKKINEIYWLQHLSKDNAMAESFLL